VVKDFSEEASTPVVGASSAHSGHCPAHRDDAPVDAVPASESGSRTASVDGVDDDGAAAQGAHVAGVEQLIDGVPPGGNAQEVPPAVEAPAGLWPDDAGHSPEAGAAEAPDAVVVPARPREVTVEDGESLESIAAHWGMDAGELAALNAWLVPNPHSLFPGQILRLRA